MRPTSMPAGVNSGGISRVFALCSLLVLSGTPGGGWAAPDEPAQVLPADQTKVLIEILNELRGLRNDIRALRAPTNNPAAADARNRPPAEIPLGVGPGLGNSDAKVAVIEFTDFQCPFCKRYEEQTFARIKEKFIDPGTVRYEVRDYPLTAIHPQAREAAIAARCAGKQGAFWSMREGLFANQNRLGAALYAEIAKGQGVDAQAFDACAADPNTLNELNQAITAAESLGVRGTPHFYLGRVKDGRIVDVQAISGAQPFESFERSIGALLEPRQ